MKKATLFISILLMVHLVNAQITFQKTYGGTGDNQGYCVQQTIDGGYIIAGKSNSFGLGYTDIFIIKTNAAGDTIWTKAMGSTGIDIITSVRQTTDGGFIFGGVYAPPPSYSYAFLMKTDSSGNILWTKAYGNNLSQDGRCAQQTSDGGYILCGNVVTGATSNDYLLLKTDSAGVVSWSKAYGSNGSDFAYYVEQTGDGGFVFTGFSGGSMELIKTDMSGNLQWSKNYGNGIGNCVHQTTDGGYAILGYSSSAGLGSDDITLKKTDGSGNLLWSYRYGGINSERGYSFAQTADEGYIVSCTTSAAGLSKLLLIKTDSTGSVLWSKVFGSSGFSEAGFAQQTVDGGYAVLGKYGSSTNNYIYFVKTDTSGASGCNQADTTISVLTDTPIITIPGTAANTFFIGNVVPAVSVIATPPSVSVNTLCFSSSVMQQAAFEHGIVVTPNPSNGNFSITFKKIIVKSNVEILNILGKIIFTENIFNESKMEISLKNICSGVYFVKVFDGEESYCKKLIVE